MNWEEEGKENEPVFKRFKGLNENPPSYELLCGPLSIMRGKICKQKQE